MATRSTITQEINLLDNSFVESSLPRKLYQNSDYRLNVIFYAGSGRQDGTGIDFSLIVNSDDGVVFENSGVWSDEEEGEGYIDIDDTRFPATLPAASGVNLTALNASNLASGTVPDARFPATLPAASGANLTSLPAANLTGTVSGARLTPTINAQTGTSYTLALVDEQAVVTMSNASANVLTIPTNASVAYPTGTIIEIRQIAAGVTSIEGDTGVTLNGVSAGSGDIVARWQGVSLLKTATDTWIVSGAIGTVA
jgi:hypothetical protein